MQGKIVGTIPIVIATACQLVSVVSTAYADPPTYRMTQLPAPIPYVTCIPLQINIKGDVTGFCTHESPVYYQEPVIWRDSVLHRLGTLPDGTLLEPASGLNDDGIVVGGSAWPSRAYIWRDGSASVIPGAPSEGAGNACAINSAGQIAGVSPDGVYIWENGAAELLPGFDGYTNIWCRDLNSDGVLVGFLSESDGGNAFVWKDGTVTIIGAPPGGTNGSNATAVNSAGHVVGAASFATGHHAYLWQDGVLQDLGRLPHAFDSMPFDINDKDQVVGISDGPFLWQDGTMYNLRDLIDPTDPLAPYVSVGFASGINERGQIATAGYDRRTSELHVYVLTPLGPPVEELIATLRSSVDGIGPDRKLPKAVDLIQAYFESDDEPSTCAQLTYFNEQVQKLVPHKDDKEPRDPKITQDHADALIGQSAAIAEAVGCP